MAWPTVGETLKRAPKGKEAGLICALKLSGKKTTGKSFSGESLLEEATEGAIPQKGG